MPVYDNNAINGETINSNAPHDTTSKRPVLHSADATSGDSVQETPDTIQVCWLPSLPLVKKHRAPPISGLGILYSETLEAVLQVFETDNLSDGFNEFNRYENAALNIDPACRLCWIEIPNPTHRSIIKTNLIAQILE